MSHICGDMDEVGLLSSDSCNMLMSWKIGMHVSIYNIPYFIHPPGKTRPIERSICRSIQCNSNNNHPYRS